MKRRIRKRNILGLFENRGIALIVVIGILTILTLIGVTFALNALFESRMARNYANTIRAKYAAEAGLARAIAELKDAQTIDCVDATTDTWYSAGYQDSAFPDQNGSYVVTAGVSAVPGIVDCASRINLNGFPSNRARLSAILSSLNTAVQATYPGNPLSAVDCQNIANNAPYASKEEIKMYLTDEGANTRSLKYNKIAPYLTVFGYVDDKVINPQDVFDANGNPRADPYHLEPRSPVNVNTASAEVIRAVLTGLSGQHVCPNCGGDGSVTRGDSFINTCPSCVWGSLSFSGNEPMDLADYIVGHRAASEPYYAWNGREDAAVHDHIFYNHVRHAPWMNLVDLDLVMANANPNTGFSWARGRAWEQALGGIGKYVVPWRDLNNDGSRADELQGLLTSTTEFSFNSGGYYEITSTGSYMGARKTITAVVKIFDIHKDTTQEDWYIADDNYQRRINDFNSRCSNVTTYPEPFEALQPARERLRYDGQVMVAKSVYGQPNNTTDPYFFRANYIDGFDAASGNDIVGHGGTPRQVFEWNHNNDNNYLISPPQVRSIVDFSFRSNAIPRNLQRNTGRLQPDGLLLDNFNQERPYYYPEKSIRPDRGSYEIWFKPKFNSRDDIGHGYPTPPDVGRNHRMLRLTSYEWPAPVEQTTFKGSDDLPNMRPFITLILHSVGADQQLHATLECSGFIWCNASHNPSESPEPRWEWMSNNDLEWGQGGSRTQYTTTSFVNLGANWNDVFQSGEWHHCVITWATQADPTQPPDTGSLRMYFDGNLKLGTQNWLGKYYYHTPFSDNANSLLYGDLSDTAYSFSIESGFEQDVFAGNAEFSNAILGSTRIWPTTLSQAEVTAHFNDGFYNDNGTDGTYYTSVPFQPAEAVRWGSFTWTMTTVPSEHSGAFPDGYPEVSIRTGADPTTFGRPADNDAWREPGTGGKVSDATGQTVSDYFQYRIVFPSAARDTPVLEDFSITYMPRTHILYYREQ